MGDDGEKFFEKVTGKSRDNAGLVTLPFLRIPLGGCATDHLPPAACSLKTTKPTHLAKATWQSAKWRCCCVRVPD